MNLLKEMARHLEFAGFGERDRDIFWGRMPDSPDACVAVFSPDSARPGAENGARVQIVNRAESPGAAYETACRIARAMDGFYGFLAGDGAMARITAESTAAGSAAATAESTGAAFASGAALDGSTRLPAGLAAATESWTRAAAFFAFAFAIASSFGLFMYIQPKTIKAIRMEPIRVFLFISFPFWAGPGRYRPCRRGCT